jgi:hypothetical protein
MSDYTPLDHDEYQTFVRKAAKKIRNEETLDTQLAPIRQLEREAESLIDGWDHLDESDPNFALCGAVIQWVIEDDNADFDTLESHTYRSKADRVFHELAVEAVTQHILSYTRQVKYTVKA